MLCIFTERLHSLSSRNNSAVQFVNKWNTSSQTSKTKQGLSFKFNQRMNTLIFQGHIETYKVKCKPILTVVYNGLPMVDWLFWAKRPFETVFQSISGRLREGGRKKREMIDERKNVRIIPIRTYCKRSRPLPYSYPN